MVLFLEGSLIVGAGRNAWTWVLVYTDLLCLSIHVHVLERLSVLAYAVLRCAKSGVFS